MSRLIDSKKLVTMLSKIRRKSHLWSQLVTKSGVTFPKCRNCGVRADDKYDSKELIEDAIIGDMEWYCDEFCASEGDSDDQSKSE